MELKTGGLADWHGDFTRQHKIDDSEKTREITLRVSEDEYELLRAYTQGFSVDALARGWQCHKSTICRSLRDALSSAFQISYVPRNKRTSKGELLITNATPQLKS